MQKKLPGNRLGRWLAGVILALLATLNAQAQLTGTKTIPGTYPTLAAAITDLNAQGVGAGGVTFSIAAGYTEMLASPTAGAITATGTSANPIVFQKAGTGANPLITAGVGTTTTVDAIISLAGSDYVTIDGLDVSESAANTTATTQMEFGYALFRPSVTDGCQFNTIRNCVVTLNKTNAATIGIAGAAGTPTSGTTVAATATTGANSANKVYGNVVTNALTGIYFNASSSTSIANYDQNNEIGVTAGNTIGNFGGAASGYGAGGNYQNGLKITGNTINSTLNYTSATASTPVAASTVTSTLRGIYTPNGTSSNLDITNNTITLASGATSSQLSGIENGMGGTATTNTVNITGNTLVNSTYATSTTATVYLLYTTSSPATLNITNNTLSANNFGGSATASATCYLIYNSGTPTTATISGNVVTNNTAAGTASLYLLQSGSATTLTLTNNRLVGNSKTGGATTSGTLYCLAAATAAVTATGNTINNNSVVTAGTSSATIYGYFNAGSPTAETLTGNIITNLSISGSTTSTSSLLYGIYSNPISTTVKSWTQNTIGALALSTGGTVYGIYNLTGNTIDISRNKVYDLSAGTSSGMVYGIYLSSGTTVTVANNLVGDLRAAASTSLLGVSGIYLGTPTTANLYYNTIYLAAASTGATFGTSGVYLASTSPVLDLRNNIIVNASTAAGTGGYAAALRRTSGTAGTAPANYATTSNNNLLYAGPPSATNLLYVEGTTTATNAQQTLAAYKAFMGSRDQQSVTENPPFLSTTGTAATFLHISPTVATQVESAGAPISGITTDFDGDPRSATTPDIGADEGTFLPQDVTGPTITLMALANTSSTANRTLAVTITDPSGISTTAAPRLFYRKGTSGAFVSALATGVSGSTYTFTFDYAALGGVAANDVIQYYVVAQDVPGNVSSSPAAGTFTTAPTTPNQYTVLSILSGIYYVGTGTSPDPTRTYATLTAAVAAYNGSGLGGAVTFLLLDAAYSTAETFPLTLNSNPEASATNTLTIRPNAGVAAAITGSVATGAVLKLNGADYITIDGSNAGTTSQNLTISNASATGTGNAVLWLAAASATDGATNNTVKNTLITGNSAAGNPQFDVFLGGGGAGVTAPTTSTPAANSNNTLANNVITKGFYGVFVFGVSATVLDQGNTISGNQLGQVASGTGFGLEGLRAVYQQNLTVQGNEIQGVVSAAGASHFGLNLGTLKNALIDRNSIHDVQSTSTTSGYVGYGISLASTALSTSANASANTVSNNLIYSISAPLAVTGTNPNVLGIANGGGYGDKIYFNTVLLNGAQTAGTGYSAAISNGDSQYATATSALDVRNNIFAITANVTTAAKYFGFYTSAASVTGSILDYNDYYLGGSGSATFAVGNLNGTSLASSATLAAWQTATGQEANSKSVNPGFVQTTTVPYNLTPTAAALNSAGVAIAGITTDYAGATRTSPPDIGAIEFAPPVCQAVTNLAFTSVTSTTASITFTPPAGAGANSYTVTYAPAGGTATTVTPSPTASPIALTGLTPSTVYTVTVTTNCTGATSPSVTGAFTTLCTPPVYAALPVSESFENTWLSRCDTREVPSASWLNTPPTGDNSWRRDDDGAAANWTSTSGAYTPAGSQGSSHSARFHSYDTANGTVGSLDLYADLSAAGPKRLTFDYVNVSTGGSKLDVLLSTDGGVTFATTPLLTIASAPAFTAQTVDLTSTSATAVIRFRATSDFGYYDIGVDNVLLRALPSVDIAPVALVTPASTQTCYGSTETIAVSVSNQGGAALNFATNPATVTAVVTTPGGPQTLTGTITAGTLAAGATQTVTLAPTLNMTAVGTYSFAITATVTGDAYPANDVLTPAPTRTVAAPVAGTLTPAATSICVSGTATLTLTGAANGSIQFQSSPNGTTFTDIAGATSATYTTPVLTTTTYYRAQVHCNTGTATSNVSIITVNNPQVASTNTPVAICAGSTATLTATPSAGSSVRFYTTATGGTALANTGTNSYTTPALTASTTYYAAAYTGGQEAVGKPATNGADGTNSGGGLYFTAAGPLTLTSVTVYQVASSAAVAGTVYLIPGSSSTIANAIATYAVSLPANAAAAVTPTVLPLNFAIPAAGSYTLYFSASSSTYLVRDSPTGTATPTTAYPYTSPSGAVSITGGTLAGYYYFFYNWQTSNECAGATRTAIQVNVTPTPVATFSYPATGGNCAGSTGTVAPTLASGATAGTFTSTTGLTINATTGAVNLATSTAGTYTVTNTVAATGACPATPATAILTVNPTPARPTITPTYNGTQTTLTSSAATGNQFYYNGVAIAGATGQTYVVNGSASTYGSYTVVATNSFGCSSPASVVQVVTATKGSIAGASIQLFPNPTPDGRATLELSGLRSATQLVVLDALGRVVSSELLPATTGVVTHSLDLSRMASGVYLLRLSNAEGVATRRLTRE